MEGEGKDRVRKGAGVTVVFPFLSLPFFEPVEYRDLDLLLPCDVTRWRPTSVSTSASASVSTEGSFWYHV
jgi:hypothetical protein